MRPKFFSKESIWFFGVGLLSAFIILLSNATQVYSEDPTPVRRILFEDPVLSTTTPIKANHVEEIINFTQDLRRQCSIPSYDYAWSDAPGASVSPIRAIHMEEAREALNEIADLTAQPRGPFPMTYTDDRIIAGSTPIRAVHFTELRAAAEAISCCGDGIENSAISGEECDRTDFGALGNACIAHGPFGGIPFTGGTVTCTSNCLYSYNSCTPRPNETPCSGSLPANAYWYNKGTVTQMFDTVSRTWFPPLTDYPVEHDSADNPGTPDQCEFRCYNDGINGYYTWNGSSCEANDCTTACGTITDGNSQTFYQNSNPACGSTCLSEIRTCRAGILSGSYTACTCVVDCCNPGQSCAINAQCCSNNCSAGTCQGSCDLDGIQEDFNGEACDGADLNSQTCVSQGFPSGGTLACDGSCAFDTSGCSTCGPVLVGTNGSGSTQCVVNQSTYCGTSLAGTCSENGSCSANVDSSGITTWTNNCVADSCVGSCSGGTQPCVSGWVESFCNSVSGCSYVDLPGPSPASCIGNFDCNSYTYGCSAAGCTCACSPVWVGTNGNGNTRCTVNQNVSCSSAAAGTCARSGTCSASVNGSGNISWTNNCTSDCGSVWVGTDDVGASQCTVNQNIACDNSTSGTCAESGSCSASVNGGGSISWTNNCTAAASYTSYRCDYFYRNSPVTASNCDQASGRWTTLGSCSGPADTYSPPYNQGQTICLATGDSPDASDCTIPAGIEWICCADASGNPASMWRTTSTSCSTPLPGSTAGNEGGGKFCGHYTCTAYDPPPNSSCVICFPDGDVAPCCTPDGTGCACVGGGCFTAGTSISLADGTTLPIEKVKVGMKVKAAHGNINTIIELNQHAYNGPLYAFNQNEKYFVSESHPFLTTTGWKAMNPQAAREEIIDPLLNIDQLKVGDILITEKGQVELKDIRSQNQSTTVYNFHVDGDQTYIADGFVVHNKG